MSAPAVTINKGNAMQSDRFLVTHQQQPRGLMSWPRAAKLLLEGRSEFLHFDSSQSQVIRGRWSVTCLPFKGLTNKPLHEFGVSEARRIASMIEQLKKFDHPLKYSRIDGMESLLRTLCEYPPYSLDDDWDGKASKRRSWALLVFRTQQHLRV